MIDRKMKRRSLTALMAVVVVGLSGCIDYTIETTLKPDGSGHRSVRVAGTDAHRLTEDSVTHEEFLEFMSLSKNRGWTHDVEIQADGDTTYLFTRNDTVTDLSGWTELDSQILIRGARGSSADTQVGYVTLGNVQFRNSVRVESGGLDDGTVTFKYQETFRWTQAMDVLMEFFVGEMDRSLAEAYPRLSERERGEIVGAARANLWSAVDEGLLDDLGGEEDELWNQALDRTVTHGIKVVNTKYQNAGPESLKQHLDLLTNEDGESNEDPIGRLDFLLPGFSTATNTEFKFYLTMPGLVTNTNAHSRDGNLLTWEFNPADALGAPIVLVAESIVGG